MAGERDVVHTVRRFLATCDLSTASQRPGSDPGPLCVAVSGGVDSMVLLHTLSTTDEKITGRVEAVHVNHHARQESDADQQLVEGTCAAWGIPCHVEHVRAGAVPTRERRGLEADLRRLRYQALISAANKVGANRVCLAHHADDQLETVLWRLLRGTGGRGVGGMRPLRKWSGIDWLRPLLGVDKAALYAYAAEHDVPFAEDSTNRCDQHTRNALRQHVIPALKQIQPQVARTVANFSRIVQEEDAWMDTQARALLKSSAMWKHLRVRIDIARFRQAAPPLQRRAIQIVLYYLGSDQISFAHVEQVLRMAFSETPSSELVLPNDCLARREYDLLWLERKMQGGAGNPPYSLTWPVSAASVLDLARTPPAWSWRFTCEPWRSQDGTEAASQFELRILQNAVMDIKSVSAGDRIRLSQGGHKKLQDVFVDAKVPRRLREQWPIVWQGGEIVWVPGLRRSGTRLIPPGEGIGFVIRAYPYTATDVLSAP